MKRYSQESKQQLESNKLGKTCSCDNGSNGIIDDNGSSGTQGSNNTNDGLSSNTSVGAGGVEGTYTACENKKYCSFKVVKNLICSKSCQFLSDRIFLVVELNWTSTFVSRRALQKRLG